MGSLTRSVWRVNGESGTNVARCRIGDRRLVWQHACVNTPIEPGDIAPPAANYVHAVRSESPTAWLHTSGVVPTAADGTTPESVGEQARVVWANIAAMLRDAEMSPSDIVSVTTYVVVGEPLGEVMVARDEFLGQHRAASTLVTVPELAQPQWRLEVAVIAAR